MSYQVIARKWRPQSFDQIVFQEHISRTLRNSIVQKRISHAFLFSGPRGVGKTTMARVLAKALNCLSHDGPTPEPCGVCDNCKEIRESSSFDVIEIDGASNRGIEDIRELRENVNFAPFKSRYKVYIIDEVHMLTKEAFNALLKTLEEPPSHIIFIFATTEIHQIPETILSRCQKYFFKKIPLHAIIDHLNHIVEKEGYRVSDKALYPVARAADGSMRDAQSLLEQVISFSNSTMEGEGKEDAEISEDDTLSILGIVSLESYVNLMRNIIDNDASASMDEIERLSFMGIDIPRYADGFVDIIRIMRLIKHNVSVQEMLGFSDDEISAVKDTAAALHDEELSAFYRIVLELQRDLRFSAHERVNLEMAVLDMMSVKKMPSLADIVQRLEGAPRGNPEAPARETGRETPSTGTGKAAPGKKPALNKKKLIPDLDQAWNDFFQSMQNEQPYLFSILKNAVVQTVPDGLVISFPKSENPSLYNRMLDTKKISLIKDGMEARTGKRLRVEVEASEKRTDRSDDGQTENGMESKKIIANELDDRTVPPPDAEMVTKPETEGLNETNPAVDKIKSIFLGEIIVKGDE